MRVVSKGPESSRYCDGLSRRSFVQAGLWGMGALGVADVLRAKDASRRSGSAAKDTSLILLWLDGGPSHMDTYDMKPDAPAEYRGIWRPIDTNVPGVQVTELFPLQAKIADRYSVIRSMHHDNGDHFTGGHWMLTGRGEVSGGNTPGRYPFFGAIATKMAGPRQPGMPANVAIPYASSIGLRPGYFGGNYLGVRHDPFETEGDPNQDRFEVKDLRPQVALERLEDRRGLLKTLDRMRRDADAGARIAAMDQFSAEALELTTGAAARRAFDLSLEDPRLRDRYGRHSWGQSTLLARRLVEAGSTVATVHFGGWDHHWDLEPGMNRYLPQIDQLVSALFLDLEERGLLEKVMVVLCGEFSRTPRMNDGGNGGAPGSMGKPGRDHWGNALSVLIGGGGVKGGRLIGSTNRLGEAPKDHPLQPGDLHHTIFRHLGVDPNVSFLNHAGRPIAAVDHGAVIDALF